jgi:hypothetical protein
VALRRVRALAFFAGNFRVDFFVLAARRAFGRDSVGVGLRLERGWGLVFALRRAIVSHELP